MNLSNVVQKQLLECLAGSSAGISLFDPQNRLRYANPYFLSAYATALEDATTWESMMRRCHRDKVGLVIDSDDIEAWLTRVQQGYRRTAVRIFESDLHDGRWMRVTETLQASGWLLIVATDITSLKINETSLQNARDEAVLLSVTDPLTGIYNRRFIFERLSGLISSATDLRFALTVVAIDLDHFKKINDVHGHTIGDQMLIYFARHIHQHLRPQDFVGRIGGEEFLMVLPNTDLQGAHRLLARLRDGLESKQPVSHIPNLRHSFSSGVVLAQAADSVDSLYSRADRALYMAKAAGRSVDMVLGVDGNPVRFDD